MRLSDNAAKWLSVDVVVSDVTVDAVAAGVAALIVAQYGRKDRGGIGLDPRVTEKVLLGTATDTACPEPRTLDYPDPLGPEYAATCEGDAARNGFYGEGLVNAFRAVGGGR